MYVIDAIKVIKYIDNIVKGNSSPLPYALAICHMDFLPKFHSHPQNLHHFPVVTYAPGRYLSDFQTFRKINYEALFTSLNRRYAI